MTNTKHTPTPWQTDGFNFGEDGCEVWSGPMDQSASRVAVFSKTIDANFVVKACNEHDALHEIIARQDAEIAGLKALSGAAENSFKVEQRKRLALLAGLNKIVALAETEGGETCNKASSLAANVIHMMGNPQAEYEFAKAHFAAHLKPLTTSNEREDRLCELSVDDAEFGISEHCPPVPQEAKADAWYRADIYAAVSNLEMEYEVRQQLTDGIPDKQSSTHIVIAKTNSRKYAEEICRNHNSSTPPQPAWTEAELREVLRQELIEVGFNPVYVNNLMKDNSGTGVTIIDCDELRMFEAALSALNRVAKGKM